MPAKTAQVKVCLSEQTRKELAALCEFYEFRPSAMVTHLIRTAAYDKIALLSNTPQKPPSAFGLGDAPKSLFTPAPR